MSRFAAGPACRKPAAVVSSAETASATSAARVLAYE
jgi:hypothetical protein